MDKIKVTKLNRVYHRGKRSLDVAKKIEIIITYIKQKFNISKTSRITKYSRPVIYKIINSFQQNKITKQQKLGRRKFCTIKNNQIIHRFIERALSNNPFLY